MATEQDIQAALTMLADVRDELIETCKQLQGQTPSWAETLRGEMTGWCQVMAAAQRQRWQRSMVLALVGGLVAGGLLGYGVQYLRTREVARQAHLMGQVHQVLAEGIPGGAGRLQEQLTLRYRQAGYRVPWLPGAGRTK